MNILNELLKFRAFIVRYFMRKNPLHYVGKFSLKPVSTKFGFDRGTPIDRYWIDKHLLKYKTYIHGSVLEIGDNRYTLKFGAAQVVKSSILDVKKSNKRAAYIGDLKNLKDVIPDESFDCIILTHVLGIMDDPIRAVSECYRILRPGGYLLVTSACISPTYSEDIGYWRFTPASLLYVLLQSFSEKKISIDSYGNVLSAQLFLTGFAQEEIDKEILEYNDKRFCCVVGACAQK